MSCQAIVTTHIHVPITFSYCKKSLIWAEQSALTECDLLHGTVLSEGVWH